MEQAAENNQIEPIKPNRLKVDGPYSLIGNGSDEERLLWHNDIISKAKQPGLYILAVKDNKREGNNWYVSYIGKSEDSIGARISEHISQYFALRYNLYTSEVLKNPTILKDYNEEYDHSKDDTRIFKYYYSPSIEKSKHSLINSAGITNDAFVKEYFENFPNISTPYNPMGILKENLEALKVFTIPIPFEDIFTKDEEKCNNFARLHNIYMDPNQHFKRRSGDKQMYESLMKLYIPHLERLEALFIRHYLDKRSNDMTAANNFIDNYPNAVPCIYDDKKNLYEVDVKNDKGIDFYGLKFPLHN